MIPVACPPSTAFLFGPFRLRVADRILERAGERIPLTPKVIDTLFVLIENAGQVVTKEALMEAVWPDVTVVESGLTRNISVLRKALEEGMDEGAFIETIPRRGYRFVAEVTEEALVPPLPEPAPTPKSECLPPPAVRAEPRRSWQWLFVTAGLLASFACLWAVVLRGRTTERRHLDPFVRIGEHLLYKMAPEQAVRAMEHFERAIAANPKSASAHAGLSVSLIMQAGLAVPLPPDSPERAERAAQRALELDPGMSTAHFAMGMLHMFRRWDFPAAEAEFRKALEIEPASVQTRLGYARLKQITGEPGEAQRLVEEALELDPASPPLGVEYCRVFYFARDFRRAESECRKVLDREPGYAQAHYYLGLSLGALGRVEEAARSIEASGLMPGVVEADQAWLRIRSGDTRPAMAVLESRRELMRRGTVSAVAKLLPAAILGRNDEAFEALEAGLANREPELLSVHIDPRLDRIRSDPRYPSLLRRAGIAR